MRGIALGVSAFFLATSFVWAGQQTGPIAGQKEWVELMKKQSAARKTLNEQLTAEREAFLKKYPEMAAVVVAQMKMAKERADKRKAELEKKQK